MLEVRYSVSSEISAKNCGRLQRKNISRPCGESDTNLWMSQGSEPLGCFISLLTHDTALGPEILLFENIDCRSIEHITHCYFVLNMKFV